MVQLNPLLLAFLTVFLLRSAAQVFLNRLNVSHLRRQGDAVPEEFREVIGREKLARIRAYTVDAADFGILSALASQLFFLLLLLSGLLPWLAEALRQPGWGPAAQALPFFGVLALAGNLLQAPFSLYDTFVLEARYGFNTLTPRLWLADLLKSLALSALLGGLILFLFLSLAARGGTLWWFWAWVLAGGVELLLIWLFPLVLAPLFNKFAPVEDPELVRRIEGLMEKAGLRSRGVFQMDASRRSRHTNAYFTGLGRSKRIVLFDTLLQSHTPEEIEAVLAHEIGHWKKRHVLKQLLLIEALSLAGFFLLSRLLDWPLLYLTFGFAEPVLYAGLLLAGALFGPLGYFAQPLGSALSRKMEREADDAALELIPSAEPLAAAFKRLAADNLANLNPHPLHAWFYSSHPPLAERIRRLSAKGPGAPKGSPPSFPARAQTGEEK